jgi:outer membrane biosynthesis protein TonB
VSDDPHCPFVSRAARRVLTARFAVLVDADGRVLDAHVTLPSGREPEHLILDGALVEALRRFHFLPAHAAGHAQRGWSTVECALRFKPAAVREETPVDPVATPP